MTVSSRLVYLFFVILLVSSAVYSQFRPYKFKRITLEDGLSQSSVGRIFEDKQGFIWISTEDGLNRYDGSSIKVYRHSPSDSNSIMSSWVGGFLEDKHGNLWMMPFSNGLVMYDRKSDSFKNFYYPKKSDNISMLYDQERDLIWLSVRNQVYYFHTETRDYKEVLSDTGITYTRMTIHDNNAWVNTSTKLYKIDLETKNLEQIRVDSDSKVFTDFNSIISTHNGSVFIGSRLGLFKYSPKNNKIDQITKLSTLNAGIVSLSAEAYIFDQENKFLWVSTLNNGLIRINLIDENDVIYYGDSPETPLKYSISANRVHYLTLDQYGKLWLATDFGMSYYDTSLDRFVAFFSNPFGHQTRKIDSYNYAFTDRAGNTWLSTRLEGVSVISKNKGFNDIYWFYDQFIKDIKMTKGEYQNNLKLINEYLANLPIRDLLEDIEGNIWFASDNKLVKLVKKTGAIEFLNPMVSNMGFPANNVGDIIQDKSGKIWLLPYDGQLGYLNDDHKTSITIENNLYGKGHSSFVYAGYIDCNDILWYGDGGFIEKYDINSGTFSGFRENRMFKNQSARFWFEESDTVIWIGATEKLIKHNRNTGTFTEVFLRYKNTKPGTIYPTMCLAMDSESNFWIGTYGGGLVYYNRKTGEMKNYRVDEGLSNDYILELQFDRKGHLWISTNDGLSQFDVQKEEFQRHNYGDGTVSREFNSGSSLLTRDGIMLFGGTEGLTAFYPDSISKNTTPPNVVLTSFKKFNKEVKLSPDIQVAEEIEIDYKDNLISFEFTALNFINPDSNKYAYMLEGFDDEWIYNGNRKEAFFTNLDPGEYIFRVKASNNDGVWNEKGASVRLIINPPFYLTWWFKLLVILAFGMLLYTFYLMRLNKIRAVDAVKIAEQENALVQEKKIKTEISRNLHDEVNTELTLIANTCRELSKETTLPDSLRTDLSQLFTLSLNVRGLIDDVIWFIRPENDSDSRMVGKLVSTVSGMLKFIDFDSDIEEDIFDFPDGAGIHFKKQIYLILKESLQNIIKHSGATAVKVAIKRSGNRLSMIVEDNGSGFDTTVETERSGLANMKKRAFDIGGELEVVSAPGEGTRVSLVIEIT